MVGLPDCEKTLRICVTVYTQYWRVVDTQTDRQTDGQTSCHGLVCAMHTHHAVKIQKLLLKMQLSNIESHCQIQFMFKIAAL